MATRLNLYREAYASSIVATYQPIIAEWYSLQQMCTIAIMYSEQSQHSENRNNANLSTALNMGNTPKREPNTISTNSNSVTLSNIIKNVFGQKKIAEEKPIITLSPQISGKVPTKNLSEIQKKIFVGLVKLATDFSTVDKKLDNNKGVRFAEYIVKKNDVNYIFDSLFLPSFIPPFTPITLFYLQLETILSPIGVAHYYRQIYFNKEEGVGPIEEAFTIAPNETLEVIYETSRKIVHEEFMENGIVTEDNSSTNVRTSDEVSDQVSSMIQRDTSVSISANASGSIGVWSVEGGTDANLSNLSSKSRNSTVRKLSELNKTASERITKSFKVTTKNIDEFSFLNRTKRVINNPTNFPVNYGLRRVLRKVNVKIQDLGPKLVWQLYLENPGVGLIKSKFIHFIDTQPLFDENSIPDLRPRPIGGTENPGPKVREFIFVDHDPNTGYGRGKIEFEVALPWSRKMVRLDIQSIVDADKDDKSDFKYFFDSEDAQNITPPTPLSNTGQNIYNFQFNNVLVNFDRNHKVLINYKYEYEPSDTELRNWEGEKATKISEITYQKTVEEFERKKQLITEKSKIKQRPANDLRKEERYEVLNRMVGQLYGNVSNPRNPSPLEIEQFHKFFEMDEMFITVQPSWWKPKFTSNISTEGQEYEITSESEPARLGKSLGWLMQLDGDDRRNEFLNSSYVRICIPIRPFLEEAALDWLAINLAGQIGYNKTSEPLLSILANINTLRNNQDSIVITPDYVQIDSPTNINANIYNIANLVSDSVYPIVKDFDVVVPTEGFVYDKLEVNI